MSADNWKVCPKCEEKQEKEIADYTQQLYAKGLTFGEIETLVNAKRNKFTETLREDYEIYSEGFTVYVDYRCSCEKCGFSS